MKKFVFHSYIFSLFPVLSLYAINVSKVDFVQTLLPFGSLIVFCTLLRYFFHFFSSDKLKVGVLTTFSLFLFFSYGHLYEFLSYFTQGYGMGELKHWIFIPVFLAPCLLIYRLIIHSKKDFSTINVFLNYMAVFLALINIYKIAVYNLNTSVAIRSTQSIPGDLLKKIEASKKSVKRLPDVYYIVLDEYAGMESIQKLYDYDNTGFAKQLQNRGFYIADKSKTRYFFSDQSLASSLNMRYLTQNDVAYDLIRNSLTANLFKQLGYNIFIFPLDSKATFNISDKVFVFSHWVFNDFNISLIKSTMLRFLFDDHLLNRDLGQYNREKTLYIFNRLEDLVRSHSPKFIYAHIVCPHFPFVFNENGGPTPPEKFFEVLEKKYYLEQYKYINKRLWAAVEQILKKTETPPIIIIQSDHGQRGRVPRHRKYWLKVGDYWQDILNAYYLPGMSPDMLHESISPVNSFRLIFNFYFKFDLPLLED